MQFKIWISIICMFYMTNYQLVICQEKDEGNINIVIDKEIIFFEPNVSSIINVYVVATVTFEGAFVLKPVNVYVRMIKMNEIYQESKDYKVNFMFISNGSRENKLNKNEEALLKKYLPKVDSIFMNSQYEFIEDKKWRDAIKMDIGFPFKIKPE